MPDALGVFLRWKKNQVGDTYREIEPDVESAVFSVVPSRAHFVPEVLFCTNFGDDENVEVWF